ncbi:hypothetical protein Ccrd_004134 [Cynara cardunculus var. scolymus]|uniref:Uncharacterized protein n=1 Tax=Cynara cardunculus var. scolymus TaxID=59895 RepID=A0A103XN05_CYNCS|nr:hypothetical protein Ccrd_004134 [Cynara cardunculus var. scolymus]
MASATDGGGAGDGSGGGNVNLSPLLRTLAKGAAVTLGFNDVLIVWGVDTFNKPKADAFVFLSNPSSICPHLD